MQIHIQIEHPNKLGMITHNAIKDEPGFSVDLFDNVGDEIGFALLTGEAEFSERERRIWNGLPDGCTRLLGKN